MVRVVAAVVVVVRWHGHEALGLDELRLEAGGHRGQDGAQGHGPVLRVDHAGLLRALEVVVGVSVSGAVARWYHRSIPESNFRLSELILYSREH